MRNSLSLAIAIGSVVFVAGCVSNKPLQSGAEAIRVTTQTVPTSCQYVGTVSAGDSNGSSQMFNSHEHLLTDEMNTLKNQALPLGANVIVMTNHQTTYYASPSSQSPSVGARKMGSSTEPMLNRHALAGKAYRCDSAIANRLTSSILEEPVKATVP